ncbi:DNA gyrase subunit A [Mycoplasma sp. Ms02]|uniref:DNA gyrase subunit A n=1 Tax=Mycoplasma sp. Ms02 TaxID=353851 RepID=UPI001C88F5F2|nr:DNA gyrase subunit A [Mycoplasma sp. Ms02]QZE12101.1 DNA gyrase subunit A [Mycoplasma sp. Ms02]
MSQEKDKKLSEESLVSSINEDFEYEEESRLVFKKKEKKIIEEPEEVAPQNDENYKVYSQIITSETDGLKPVLVDNEVRSSFLEYAMSVIVSRALPDARDGLKPVHRRILFDMLELGITHSSQHRKSARIVGDVLGKYHPHGDSSVYGAMVRLAQDFSMRYPLVDGHGNFGSIDGDEAAAMRYTEARMSKLAGELLNGIKKNTVDFVDNYDASEIEPSVLPSRFPNLLVSGSSGIAVGLATEIPPHNLAETIDATIAYAKNKDITVSELMEHIKGPDFPTSAIILGKKGIIDAYETGKGKVVVRSKTKIEEFANGKSRIIVTEIPYAIKKTTIIEKIVDLHKSKVVEGISELRDESNRDGIRIVIDIKRNHNPHIVLNKLLQKSPLQSNFNVNMVALVNGEPKILNLKMVLDIYLEHQKEVVTRRLRFDLEKAEEKHHILLGLRIATSNIDRVIKIIRGSKTDAEAQEKLGIEFSLTEKQTKAILDMNLRRLTGLSIEKTNEEISELEKEIAYYKGILESSQKLIDLIIEEMTEIKEKFSDKRRTFIDENGIGSISEEDLIPRKDIIITTSTKGYVKRTPLDEYQTQRRGGIGSNSMKTYDDDDVANILQTTTHTDLLVFTNLARVYKLKAYSIPEGSKQSKGTPFVNLIPNLNEDEKVISMITVDNYTEDSYLTTVSQKGIIKKTKLSEYENINRNGKFAFGLKDGDKLSQVFISGDNSVIIVANNEKNLVMFKADTIRAMSRTSAGVTAIKLGEHQYVSTASVDSEGEYILTIGKEGYGKITHKDDFRLTRRGAKGVTAINSEKAGALVFAKFVNPSDEAMIITESGLTIRTSISNINEVSRNSKGVKIINLRKGDQISSVEIIKDATQQEEVQE